MFLALTLSSVASGVIATALMILFLYLPIIWGGLYYDSLGSLGAIVTGRVDNRSRILGALGLIGGGIFFAVFYGWAVLMFLRGGFPAPEYTILPNWPVPLNLFYPLMGLVMGLSHGIFISLITVFVVTDVHPVESYREPFPLLASYIVGHIVYGATVMFFQSQFLHLLSS